MAVGNGLKKSTERESYIRDDNSVTNLEISLEDALKDLKDYFSPIFVIDELDYFERKNPEPDPNKPKIDIMNIVKTYKNLFNLSDAVFIFIAGHKAWESLQHGIRKDMQHTLYSSSMFITKPEFKDMRVFIKEISVRPSQWENSEGERALSYLLFKAKSEYYDLKNVINNSIVDYQSDYSPVLNIEADVRSSMLQDVLEKLYEYQKFEEFERNEENYKLLEDFYIVCHSICDLEFFNVFETDDFWVLHPENVKSQQMRFNQNWFKNLINRLLWLRLIEKTGETTYDGTEAFDLSELSIPSSPANKSVRYRWTNITRRIPSKITDIETEEVKVFKQEIRKLTDIILNIENLYNFIRLGSRYKIKNYIHNHKLSNSTIEFVTKLSGITINPFYSDQYKLLAKLETEIPDYINAEDLLNYSASILNLINQITSVRASIISKIVGEVMVTKFQQEVSIYTESDNPVLLEKYPDLRNLIQNQPSTYIVLANSSGKKILICNNLNYKQFESSNPSVIKELNDLRIINLTDNIDQITIKKSVRNLVADLYNFKLGNYEYLIKEGKSSLNKIAKFIRWMSI